MGETASPANVDHGARWFKEARLADVVTGFFAQNNSEHECAQIIVAASLAHFSEKVVLAVGEEACSDLPIRGEPDAAAGSAKGLGYWRDNADFAYAILKSVAASGFARCMGSEWAQRKDLAQARNDFSEWDNHFGGPQAAFFEGHEFNETDNDVLLAGKVGESFHLIVVEAAQQDAVDFDRPQASFLRGANPANDRGKAAGDARDSLKCGLIHGIHADGNTMQASGGQRRGQFSKQVPVGRDGYVERLALGRSPACEFADNLWKIAAQQRFAARQPDLFDAQRNEDADEAEVILSGQLSILGAFLAGAAVDALVVAAVGDGDAQVGDDATMAIQQAGGRLDFIGLDDGGESGHPSLQAN